MEIQRTWKTQIILKNNDEVGELKLTDFKLPNLARSSSRIPSIESGVSPTE
jgi:hypothetical protein